MIFSNKIASLSVKNFDKQIRVRSSATVETLPGLVMEKWW